MTAGAHRTFEIDVDYNLPLARAIWKGNYEHSSVAITRRRFPRSGNGTARLIAEIVPLAATYTVGEAEAIASSGPWRPATLDELLAFGAAHPDVQVDAHQILGRILAMGSVRFRSGIWPQYPALESIVGHRTLALYESYDGFIPRDTTALLRVRQA